MARRSCLQSHAKGITLLLQDRIMITIIFDNCNTLSQDVYDQMIDRLPIHRLICSCKKSGHLILYGHYKRSARFFSTTILLSIQRVWCKACHKSHALIPSLIIPYSQIPLGDQQQIIDCAEHGKPFGHILSRNLLIDENNVKYILRQYQKHWKQRLLSIGLNTSDALTVPCLSVYLRQFMQIHRTPNILFAAPT